jgi:hypothetical protein
VYTLDLDRGRQGGAVYPPNHVIFTLYPFTAKSALHISFSHKSSHATRPSPHCFALVFLAQWTTLGPYCVALQSLFSPLSVVPYPILPDSDPIFGMRSALLAALAPPGARTAQRQCFLPLKFCHFCCLFLGHSPRSIECVCSGSGYIRGFSFARSSIPGTTAPLSRLNYSILLHSLSSPLTATWTLHHIFSVTTCRNRVAECHYVCSSEFLFLYRCCLCFTTLPSPPPTIVGSSVANGSARSR